MKRKDLKLGMRVVDLKSEFIPYTYEIRIPKIKERWMTRKEILLDNLNHPRRLVKLGKSDFTFATAFSFCDEIENYRYIDIPEDYHGDFSDLPIKKYRI